MTDHQGKANQNYAEIAPHIHDDGYHQKHRKQQASVRLWKHWKEPLCTAVGNVR